MRPNRFSRSSLLVVALLVTGCSSWRWIRQDEPTAATPTKTLAGRIDGRWRRPGDASCAVGPEISSDHGRLIIVIDGRKSVHQVEGSTVRKVSTRVIDPAGGPRYRLRSVSGEGADARNFQLTVQNRSTGATVTWTACSLS